MYKLRNRVPDSIVSSNLLGGMGVRIKGSSKVHINSLFSSQKAGIRAIMPSFVISKFKDGITSTHTKSYFTKTVFSPYIIILQYYCQKCTNLHAQNQLDYTSAPPKSAGHNSS